jgi:ABC-type multidrug transport system permease subunit
VILHFLIFCLLSLAGNSIGLIGGCMFKDVKVASGVLPIFIMPLVLFSGFYQNRGNMMIWISWLEYLSPLKYAYEAVMVNQYENLNAEVQIVIMLAQYIGKHAIQHGVMEFCICAHRIHIRV